MYLIKELAMKSSLAETKSPKSESTDIDQINATPDVQEETKSEKVIVSLDHILNYEALFDKSSITKLHDCQINGSSTALWSVGWRKSVGYRYVACVIDEFVFFVNILCNCNNVYE